MNNFVQYIAGLAETGETALVVLQKQTATGFVWLPQLPSAKMQDGKAWYMNTGSFMLDRMPKKLSASKSNAEYVLCMMLDDIGTKSKAPPLQPTWIIETSKGSFQYGYTFSEQPTKAEFVAAITAIAEAGYTDPGSCNAVRNFRIPGSVNLKEGRGKFASVLVEFTPEREFSVAQICLALDVTPIPFNTLAGGREVKPLHLKDTGKDTVLAWLNEQNMVLSPVNDQGWLSVLCPNHGEHSDGQVFARYHPVDRAFMCYHGHCVDLGSKTFLKWVQDNGGPSTQPGLREDLMSQVMTEALSRLTPTGVGKEKADMLLKEIEEKEASRVDKIDWYKRFAYVQNEDSYFDLDTKTLHGRNAFNALFRHINCRSIHGENVRKIEASICFDENRQSMGAKVLSGLTYAAGDALLVAREGDIYGNRWKDARPAVDREGKEGVDMWLTHGRLMMPNEDEFQHVLNVMAYKLQNPKIKINHAVLHAGREGCGKDTFWAPFIWSVCGPSLSNRGFMDNNNLSTPWGYHLESEILLINELKEPNAADRRALANTLKPVIAAPPEFLLVNRKGTHPYQTANRLFVLAFSNDQIPISLASQDRRWFAVWSEAPRMCADKAATMWKWYKAGGFEAITAWLYQRDVSMFNPAAAPKETDFKRSLIENSMNASEAFLVEMIQHRVGEFAEGIICSPFHTLCDRVSGLAAQGTKIYPSAMLHSLQEAGWIDRGPVKSRENPSTKRVFIHPRLAHKSNSELRNMVEAPRNNSIRILAK